MRPSPVPRAEIGVVGKRVKFFSPIGLRRLTRAKAGGRSVRVKAWLSIFTRPLVAGLVIMLLGVMSGQGRALNWEDGGTVVLRKASAKIQTLAVIHEAAGFKVAPLAKTQKAVWYELRSGRPLPVAPQFHARAPQIVVNTPELPRCQWVGVIVLRV